MEFTILVGPSAQVGSVASGQRLQKFASNAFREQLGRQGASRLHASCKSAAHRQTFLVNGVTQPGRHVLRAGDVVTLAVGAADGKDEAQQRVSAPAAASRARMALGGGADDEEHQRDRRRDFALDPRCAFVRYYTSQLPGVRWPDLEAACALPMPLCVRPNVSVNSQALVVHAIASMHGTALRRVPWLPAACVVASGDEAQISQLVLEAQSCGELALQEMAAMLPALALAPGPHHRVLDMCAAPGGKTLQMLDAMMASALGSSPLGVQDRATAEHAAHAWAARQLTPSGVLVSNDVQWQRQERTLRRASCQPCVPLVVTCGDATRLGRAAPAAPAAPAAMAPVVASARRAEAAWHFDRVLCDVPCTGDGTLRKSPDVLGRWSVVHGLRAHVLQLSILRRGLELLSVGGRLAYSTCSLDPLQNEAVICAALNGRSDLRLLPPAEALPPCAAAALQAHIGLVTWRVPHPGFDAPEAAAEAAEAGGGTTAAAAAAAEAAEVAGTAAASGRGVWYSRWDEVPPQLRGDEAGTRDGPRDGRAPALFASMFPADGAAASAAMAVPTAQTLRLLPTQSGAADHGGFFVAVIERLAEAPTTATAAEEMAATAAAEAAVASPDPDDDSPPDHLPRPSTLVELARHFGFDDPTRNGGPHAHGGATATAEGSTRAAEGEPSLARVLPSLSVTAWGAAAGEEGAAAGAEDAVRCGAAGGASEAAAAREELLLCVVSAGALDLLGTTLDHHDAHDGTRGGAHDGGRLIGAGLPLFARMPASCGWWPRAAPWRVCQEGAALLASLAPRRRRLQLLDVPAALELLGRRRTPLQHLRALSARGALSGLETCCAADGALEPGAAVLLLPCHAPASVGVRLQPLAVAALLAPLDAVESEGGRRSDLEAKPTLLLLAADDVLERYTRVLSV